MNWLAGIPDWVKWPLAMGVALVALVIIFHRQIAEGFARVTRISFDPRKQRIAIEFGERIKQEQRRAAAVQQQMTGGPAPLGSALIADTVARRTRRDLVLETFGALQQAVRDGCVANRIPITPTLGVAEAVRRLGDARELSPDLVQLIEVVYEVGRDFLEHGLEPLEGDARAYATLTHDAMYWMGMSVLTPDAPP